MESASRRGFLMGRRSSQNPWEAFCQRVRRGIAGNLFDFGLHEDIGSARLSPKGAADVRIARALCAEHNVVLALDGVNQADSLGHQSVLWVEAGKDVAQCQRMADDPTKWFVQPGCLISDMVTAGFQPFADQPGYLTVASWLADRAVCSWKAGETYKSGLAHASVLLDDGTVATLGPFGEHNQLPLGSITLQKLIPALFQLAGQPAAQASRQLSEWPGRYRLDALLPTDGHTVNLSHLLLGHGGDLGWIEWVVFDELAFAPPPAERPYRFSIRSQAPDDPAAHMAQELDAQVKTLFDPAGLFPHPGQDI